MMFQIKKCIPLLLLLVASNRSFLSLAEASDDTKEETFNGVSIKTLAQELKQKYPNPRSNSNIFDDWDQDHGKRGDIQFLNEFYANGGKNKTQTDTMSSPSQKAGILDVIIIGAGWSGLAAAMTLEAQGITNYQVLEARDYIGGRSYTTKETFNGKEIPIDRGSMWLHGGVNHPLYPVALNAGIPMSVSSFSSRLYDNEGAYYSDEAYLNYFDELYGNGFYQTQRGRQDSTEEDEALQVSLDMYINTLTDDVEKEIIKTMTQWNIRFDTCAPLSELSLWWWDGDEYLNPRKPDLFLPGGYTSLVDTYAAPIVDKVEKEAVVTRINYKKATVQVTYSKAGSEVPTVLRTKKVIVTVPLGVLKKNSIKFVPKLPGLRRRAIRNLGMGYMNKIFLVWKEEDIFWPKDIEMLGDHAQRNTNFVFYTQSSYGGEKGMLFAFFDGNEADGTMDDQDNYKDNITKIVMQSLRNMYGPDIKDPEQVYVTKWKSDDYAGGAYSFNKLGVKQEFRKQLSRPVRGKIYIAGEATSPLYYGNTHGAYFAGVSAAAKVAYSLGAKDE